MMDEQTRLIFNPIKNERTFQEVSNEVKRIVFKGILKPGDRLLSEAKLAHQFNVGHQTVREGLRLLELSGWIADEFNKFQTCFSSEQHHTA
jgi:GntR family transcriptional repressor for pyruvate dehydrogenase complex